MPELNDAQKYYLNGFVQKQWRETPALTQIINCVRALSAGQIKPGFSLDTKYKNSRDLRPNVNDYDPAFLQILADNDIPHLLKEVTGEDLLLTHIQLRISYPGATYMDWHRDTHIYGGKIIGNVPPVHKIIFYPELVGDNIPKLKVIAGSQRRQFSHQIIDLLQTQLCRRTVIKSSNSDFLLFNTAMFHAVVPEPSQNGSWRLIYSFARAFQTVNYDDSQTLIEKYQKILTATNLNN